MKTRNELQRDVMDELADDPSLRECGVLVAVDGGTVTLMGHVRSYAERLAAEQAAWRVDGVCGVVNDLAVELWDEFQHDDATIATAAVTALRLNAWLPADAVTMTVDGGWVRLEGSVPWRYQKQEAERVAGHLQGVRGITNNVQLCPRAEPQGVERRIRSALYRAATLDARRVHVDTIHGEVILRGTVRTWIEREEAERAAWSVPGVTSVRNELAIGAGELAEV